MSGSHTATVDKYLEAIFYIDGEGDVVRPSRLAYWLGVSAPTVSEAIGRLRRDGWVALRDDRSIVLTDSGRDLATAVVRRHRILERWLVDVLEFDWATADVEADRISSAVSDAVVDQIDRSMGSPSTCPHGNVIPGRAAPYGTLIALADLEPGTTGVVRRISEVAEHEAPALLSTLALHGIRAGSRVRITGDASSVEQLRVTVGESEFPLELDAAQRIWVSVG